MQRSTKVAISLPTSVLAVVEAERKVKGESRSEYFRHAVECLLKEDQKARDIQAYIKGYTDQPETAVELKIIDKLSAAALAEEPW